MSKVNTPKIDNISEMTGAQHTAFLEQVEGVITDAYGTLIESDSLQFRQAINSYASIANFYIDSGTATEYVLNPQLDSNAYSYLWPSNLYHLLREDPVKYRRYLHA